VGFINLFSKQRDLHRLAFMFVTVKMLPVIMVKLEQPNQRKNRQGFSAAATTHHSLQAMQFR
jgi:hypothetical protein